MNTQRKVVITTTYNEMGIIIDTKAEEVAQPNLQPTCNQLATDTISRQQAIETIKEYDFEFPNYMDRFVTELRDAMKADLKHDIEALPPVQPDVIRCKDCKWWDKYSDTRGYCLAAKHGYWSEHWDISIRRTYDADWYCADAERREQKLQYADEETAQSGLMSAT